jgi:hypothetical protein
VLQATAQRLRRAPCVFNCIRATRWMERLLREIVESRGTHTRGLGRQTLTKPLYTANAPLSIMRVV